MKILETAIYDLLQHEPYYAHYLLNSQIEYDTKGLDTAGFGIRGTTPVFCFNTKFLESHTREKVVSVLKHEVLHALLLHAPQQDRASNKDKMLWNICCDCAINQHIANLPDQCITLQSLQKFVDGKKKGQVLEPFKTAEYYYEALYEVADKIQVSGMTTLDDHGFKIEGDETNPEIRRLAAKIASDKAKEGAAGKIPNSLYEALGSLNNPAKIGWKQMFRNFIASSTTNITQHTRKKTHRRLGLEWPGVKKKRVLTLGVCVDSSGSVSNEAFAEFFPEINAIAKDNTVYLIDADCEVHSVQKIKAGDTVKAERHGNGGTAYNPALKKAKELGCNAIVYFGDMDSADTPANPGVPVLWVIVGDQQPPAKFGKAIRLS